MMSFIPSYLTPIGFQPSLHTHTHTRIYFADDAGVIRFSPSVSVSSLRLSIDRSIDPSVGRRVCASSSNERIEFHFFFNSFIHDGREDDRADVVGGVSWFETMRLGGCPASVSRVVALRARRAGESGETGRSRRRRRILSTRRRRERRRRRDDDDGFSVRKR